jgi:hypothetical protein
LSQRSGCSPEAFPPSRNIQSSIPGRSF